MQPPEEWAAQNTDSTFNTELRELQQNHDREKTDKDVDAAVKAGRNNILSSKYRETPVGQSKLCNNRT
jgi:hypothetical protein